MEVSRIFKIFPIDFFFNDDYKDYLFFILKRTEFSMKKWYIILRNLKLLEFVDFKGFKIGKKRKKNKTIFNI